MKRKKIHAFHLTKQSSEISCSETEKNGAMNGQKRPLGHFKKFS